MNEPWEIRKRIIQQLKGRRQELGLSLRDVERLSGIDNSNLSAMEKGTRSLSLDTLIKLTRALGLKIVLIDADED
jgi:transcriptional regulator with XRE-family HTH domain